MALYKRRTYLINHKFQLKFSFYLAIIILVSSAIYPLMIYELYSDVSTSLSHQFPHAANDFDNKKVTLFYVLIGGQITYAALIFIVGIFFSHKIAGPLYKLQIFLKDIREGKSRGKLMFRDGDHFPEVADDFNKTMDVINNRSQKTREELEKLKDQLMKLNVDPKDEKEKSSMIISIENITDVL